MGVLMGRLREVAGVTLLVALLIDALSELGARDSGLGLVLRCSGADLQHRKCSFLLSATPAFFCIA